ncbi:hypothetical protein BH11MYX1_BH11MYX1_32960 [soil metagenome]
MGVASLVLGIIGLIISLIPFLGQYALVLTVIAVVLGLLGRRSIQGKGLATAGLVLGLIGTTLGGYWAYASHKAAKALQEELDHPRANTTTPG